MNTESTDHRAPPCARDPMPTGTGLGHTLRSSDAGPCTQILVVDDNRDAADSLAQLFGVMGATVSVAYGAQEALRAMTEAQPRIAIIDISMPGMDGYELAARIRASSSFAGVVLIALTGWVQASGMERVMNTGFDQHLMKPANIQVLTRLMESLT